MMKTISFVFIRGVCTGIGFGLISAGVYMTSEKIKDIVKGV